MDVPITLAAFIINKPKLSGSPVTSLNI